MGYEGHPFVRTPNLDQLAREGAVFHAAYSGSPVCVPGRASLMTGMYASDVGSYGNSTVWDGAYPVWGTYFRDHGYDTRAFGKLDLDDTLPLGFDSSPGQNGHKYHPDITSLFRMPLCYRVDERKIIDGSIRKDFNGHDLEVTRDAVEFITGHAGTRQRPWLLYLGYNTPHPPFTAMDSTFNSYYPTRVDMPDVTPNEIENINEVYRELRYFKQIDIPFGGDKERRARAAYYGMITELDAMIGRVILSLRESGQYGNTLIIYTSDHGESLGEHGLWLKNNLYDCAIRIPLVMEGPGIPAGTPVSGPRLPRST